MPHRPTLKTACSPAPPSLVRRLRSPCHMRTRSIGCALASPVTGRASRSHQCAPPYPPRPSHLIETKPSNITGLSLTPYSRQQKRSLSWRAPRTLPRLAATPSTRRPSISRTFQTPEILSATLPFQHDQSHAGDMDSPLTTPTLPSSTLPSYHLSPRITAFDHDLHVDFPSFISTGDWISASRLQFPYEEAKPLVDAYTLFNISDSPQGDPFV
ncbi:hypothetical protein C8Q78DRAFT_1016562 [Trametes maxima]|nr:hypothetical protein C8Q78DRAFT_1016562 [Trametes maxima]